ncbi:MAG TPA: AgmX/PglI C-terminal domain-containing protein [Steroidobacteraceae bacterium]|jgi:periplasmic protein TonB|nr:AgmX/PglI C-terminal domain-containing protein [Steroidobacteraceae bacterium]
MAAAASPAQRTAASGLVPYFRRYDLPWSPSEEMERRFRVILRNLVIAFAIIAVIIPFLPRRERVVNTESLPERVVQLVLEPPPPPPPPPPPKPEKPLEKAPVTPKPVTPPVDARVKASKSGLLASMDDLAALRDINLDKLAKNQPKTTDPGDVTEVTRSLITSKAGGTSGGISAPTSSGLAAGGGSLNGIRTAQVKDPTLATGSQGSTRAGGSGKASRGADEIALVFTRNKGAIDAMYARALRDNPALQGKVVIELTIAPSGDITAARVISSDLNDPEFESKLLARIRLFKFEAKDVATLTATKPIDFFPAG